MALFRRKAQSQNEISGSVPTPATSVEWHHEVVAELDKLAIVVRASGRKLPTIVYSKIRSIDDVIRSLMKLAETRTYVTIEQKHIMSHMVTKYIPDSLNTFLNLPESDRLTGSKSESMIIDQFQVMEKKIRQFDKQFRSGAMDELSMQGFFIQGRLGTNSFDDE